MKLRYLAVALLCAVTPAHAQKSKSVLATEISTNWPDNTSGQITPALLRSTVLDAVNSYFDLNGASSLPCASHTFLSSFPTLSTITCTQPVIADISGFGTGVATALGATVNTPVGFVTSNSALFKGSSGSTTINIQDPGATHTMIITQSSSLFKMADNVVAFEFDANTNGGNTGQLVLNTNGTVSMSGALSLAVALTGTNGGTGVNNGASTITLAGPLVHAGAFTTTITATNTTNSTLPAGTHTLAGLDVVQTFSAAQTFTGGASLGVHTGTSLALGGASIGSNALAITGTFAFSAGGTFGGALSGITTLASAAHTITASSTTALAVGTSGTTNPGLQVDTSSGGTTGLKVTAAGAGGGVALAAISSGTNEGLSINSKGTAAIQIGNVTAIGVTITPPLTANAITGTTIAGSSFIGGGNTGLTCSGTPTASFASTAGIVTHC